MKKQSGMTFPEILIIASIIAILIAVAVPAYDDYQLRKLHPGPISELVSTAEGCNIYRVRTAGEPTVYLSKCSDGTSGVKVPGSKHRTEMNSTTTNEVPK